MNFIFLPDWKARFESFWFHSNIWSDAIAVFRRDYSGAEFPKIDAITAAQDVSEAKTKSIITCTYTELYVHIDKYNAVVRN